MSSLETEGKPGAMGNLSYLLEMEAHGVEQTVSRSVELYARAVGAVHVKGKNKYAFCWRIEQKVWRKML